MKRTILFTALAILLIWTALTLWVQLSGPAISIRLGTPEASKRALIVYNPDPIYDLDAQVSRSLGKGLVEEDFYVHIASVATAKFDHNRYDLIVFCANTYNWAPDWKISGLIRRHPDLPAKPVVALTLGAGATQRAQRLLEQRLHHRGAQIVDARSYWLMRPNDSHRMDEPNTRLARDLVYAWGREIGQKLHVSPQPYCLDYGRYDK